MVRTLAALALAAVAAVPAVATVATGAHAAEGAQSSRTDRPVTLAVAPAAATAAAPQAATATAARWPWLSVSLPHTVKGRTLTYRYADAGYQYLVKDGSRVYASPSSVGYTIAFGDGATTGGNGLGGATCLQKGRLAPFKDIDSVAQKHTYAKPGRYTVTVTGYYCGTGRDGHRTRTYTVVAR